MREIKFRQYESMYGVMIHWEGDPDGPSEAHRQGLKDAIKQYGFDELAKASIFMQYTGLKDKNGKEIYNGDILSWRNYNNVEFVGVVTERPGVTYIDWMKPNEYPSYIFEAGTFKMDIIGNMYEHPHLLKEAESNVHQA